MLIVEIFSLGEYHLLGTTVDDAIGESFDKVASMLKLPYPGGPFIEKLALKGKRDTFSWKTGRVKGRPMDLSFSGLKTAVLYTIKELTDNFSRGLTDQEKENIAATFQETALLSVVNRIAICSKEKGISTVFLGGGVSCNTRFRELFHERCPDVRLIAAEKSLCVDNGAMIAYAGALLYKKFGTQPVENWQPIPRYPLARMKEVYGYEK